MVVTTPSPDPTANWKTYEDNKRGFAFKYPPDWVSPSANCGIPTPKPNELGHGRGIAINCLETIIFTEKDPINQVSKETPMETNLVMDAKITVDGFEGRKKLFAGVNNPKRYYQVWLFKENKPILVWLTSIGTGIGTGNTDSTDGLIEILDQILSTFRFLD